MPLKFYKNRYARSMHEAAKVIAPKDDTYEKILGSVLVAAGVASAVSFSAASAKAASLAKLTLLKSIGVATAVTVGVATASTAVIAPPAIRAVEVVASETHSYSEVYVQTDSIRSVGTVLVTDEQGTAVKAVRQEDGRYLAQVFSNGPYTVSVSGKSTPLTSKRIISVEGIDVDIPEMDGFHVEDERVVIRFSDGLSGVDWDSIYGVDKNGERIEPLEVNPDEGYVVFQVPEESLEVYIADNAGNLAQSMVQVY